MTRPKIKDKLPEKLPPVEPDAPKLSTPDEEKVPVKTTHPEKEEAQASSSIPGEDAKDKGKPDPGTGETDAKEAQSDHGIVILEPGSTHIKNPLPQKEEQPFLFGEADQILNALETELTQWKGTFEKLQEARLKVELKIDVALDRISTLENAVEATRKHAPMKEDPAPPDEPGGVRATPEEFDKEREKQEKEDQPEPETTTPSTDPAPEAPTPSAPVAPGAAERNKAVEDLTGKFRNPTQPLPELLFPGDILVTSWETGPYRAEKITGPYNEVDDLQRGGMLPSPDHYSIQCSDVDAKRNKDGRLAKNYAYSYLNMVIAVGNRFLSVYADSQDEVILTGEGVDKKKDISDQKPNPQPVKAEPMDEDIFDKEIY